KCYPCPDTVPTLTLSPTSWRRESEYRALLKLRNFRKRPIRRSAFQLRGWGFAGEFLRVLVRRLNNHDRDRVTEFHDVVHEDFDVVSAGGFKFDLAEDCDIGGVKSGILQSEFYFAFAEHGDLVGPD